MCQKLYDDEQALICFGKAIDIQKGSPEKQQNELIRSYDNIARIYLFSDKFDKAQEYNHCLLLQIFEKLWQVFGIQLKSNKYLGKDS